MKISVKTNTGKILLLIGLVCDGIYLPNHLKATPIDTISHTHSKSNQQFERESVNNKIIRPLVASSKNELSNSSNPSDITIKKIRPISINEINELVQENHPKVEAYRSKVDQAKQLLIESLSSWYPTINLSANGLPQYLEAEQYNSSSADTSSKQWKANISIKLSWDLIDPARIPEISAARDEFEKANASLLIVIRDLQLEATSKYFLLQQSDEGIRIGKESIKASETSLLDAKNKFKSGLGTRLEILEAEAQLSRDKQLLINKMVDQNINQRSLATALNLPEYISPIAATPPTLLGVWETSLEDSINQAYSYRERLKNLLLDISISNNNANSALASSQPTISLVNTLSNSYTKGELATSTPDMSKTGSSLSNTIGLNATWNIFDGGKAQALYKYNKYKAKEARSNYIEAKALIRQEVEESYYKLQAANLNIMSRTRELIAAKESLRLARLRFKEGIATQREIVNNQRDLTAAEVGQTDAITSYNTNITELIRKTGIKNIKPCKPNTINSSISIEEEKINTYPLKSFPIISACELRNP